MAGSSSGTLFKLTTFGESHGRAIGVIVDGCPAGLPLTEADLQPYLDRRRPGRQAFTTARSEADEAEILSGTFEGKTTGTPIAIVIRNTDQRSRDYSAVKDICRPGHADFTYDAKYGFRDYRGGGRSSGRETAARVAGGAVALLFLKSLGIEVRTEILSIGGVPASEAEELLSEAASEGDSLGGVIACEVTGLPIGLGEPVFDKIDADIAKAVLSLGAVKGIEFGEGFDAAYMRGSENNDAFEPVCPAEAGNGPAASGERPALRPATNHAGGVLGGMTSGAPLVFRTAVKPTPSISRPQHTALSDGTMGDLEIRGRHDTCIVPRLGVVIESAAAAVIADHLLRHMASRLEGIKAFYKR